MIQIVKPTTVLFINTVTIFRYFSNNTIMNTPKCATQYTEANRWIDVLLLLETRSLSVTMCRWLFDTTVSIVDASFCCCSIKKTQEVDNTRIRSRRTLDLFPSIALTTMHSCVTYTESYRVFYYLIVKNRRFLNCSRVYCFIQN